MKLLVLGGTKNLGRHVVEAAVRDDHEVTLFNRGVTNPELFPSVRRLTGQRADPVRQCPRSRVRRMRIGSV